MLFFWDVLFGTAKINRKYPSRYGVKGMRRAEWGEQFLWPLVPTPKKTGIASQEPDSKASENSSLV
jgi:sterol desaturase/sphingolipid hydroxylase (fatty acid hydroxylase superfamily)